MRDVIGEFAGCDGLEHGVGRERGTAANFAPCRRRDSFAFDHVLHRHPSFRLDALAALADRRPATPAFAYWSCGDVQVRDPWVRGTQQKPSLSSTLAGIAANDSLVILKQVERDAVFGPLVQDIMGALADRAGSWFWDERILGRATFLIASPRRITSYHLDGDTNFLFQLRGHKTLHVFDPRDRQVLTAPELENFFAGDLSAAHYRAATQTGALHYDLRPGSAVHIPVTAPHWAQNLGEVSIALSVNFDLRSSLRLAQVYRMNRRVRRLGFEPVAPEVSVLRDSLKVAAASAARGLQRAWHSAVRRASASGWTRDETAGHERHGSAKTSPGDLRL